MSSDQDKTDGNVIKTMPAWATFTKNWESLRGAEEVECDEDASEPAVATSNKQLLSLRHYFSQSDVTGSVNKVGEPPATAFSYILAMCQLCSRSSSSNFSYKYGRSLNTALFLALCTVKIKH